MSSMLGTRNRRYLVYSGLFAVFLVAVSWSSGAHKKVYDKFYPDLDYYPSVDPWLQPSRTSDLLRPATSFTLPNELVPTLPHEETGHASPMLHNNRAIRGLFECMARGTCTKNQTKVVLLQSNHFSYALWGQRHGEAVHASGILNALESQGYTYLFCLSPPQAPHAPQYYHLFPTLVHAILFDLETAWECFKDTEFCRKSAQNPLGIPAWKIFAFSYFPERDHPVGQEWVLTAEPYYQWDDNNHNTYMGYSHEVQCRKRGAIPFNDREDRAYILAKLLRFFSIEEMYFPINFLSKAHEETGLELLIGAADHNMDDLIPQIPAGLVNVGPMNAETFATTLGKSKLLIGLGNPILSPTPWEALCLGVPFIHPIGNWDHNNRTDRRAWWGQHNMMKDLDPPYVYHVFADDEEAYVEAVRKASTTPIESFIPDRMLVSSVNARVAAFMEKDWEAEGQRVLDVRIGGASGDVSPPFLPYI